MNNMNFKTCHEAALTGLHPRIRSDQALAEALIFAGVGWGEVHGLLAQQFENANTHRVGNAERGQDMQRPNLAKLQGDAGVPEKQERIYGKHRTPEDVVAHGLGLRQLVSGAPLGKGQPVNGDNRNVTLALVGDEVAIGARIELRRIAGRGGWHGSGCAREFGPNGLPVVGAKVFTSYRHTGYLLDGYSKLWSARPLRIHHVLKVPARCLALRCESVAIIRRHGGEVGFEVHTSLHHLMFALSTSFDVILPIEWRYG